MAKRHLPSVDEIRQLVEYNSATGKLFWKPREHPWWNTRYAGKEAGSTSKGGYLSLRVYGEHIPAHRVAWAVVHGRWPKGVIDHIDGDRQNNRLDNLRDISFVQNLQNRLVLPETGVVGVIRIKKTGKYFASIKSKGKSHSLGHFDRLEDAARARRAAEIEFGHYLEPARRQ